MYPINFKANFVKNINIQKKDGNSQYVPYNASMAEVDPKNENDLCVLEDVNSLWKKNIFCNNIAELAYGCDDKEKVYIITEQKENFRDLEPQKVLGLMSVYYTPQQSKVHFLEVKKDDNYNHIGSKLVKQLQTKTNYIDLFCASSSLFPFYYKLGFVHDIPDAKHMLEKGKMHWGEEPKEEIQKPTENKQIKRNFLGRLASSVRNFFQ